jgi:alpha-soluble NSF attachment protein
MSDSASKGQELLSKAEKKMKGIALFGNKWEEASEMLEKAANHFKLAKLCACSPDT